MLQTSTALNVCQYLLLKAEYAKSSSSSTSSKEQDKLQDDNDANNHVDDVGVATPAQTFAPTPAQTRPPTH